MHFHVPVLRIPQENEEKKRQGLKNGRDNPENVADEKFPQVNFKIPVTDTEPFRNQNQSAPFELHIPLSRVLIA
ncbi:hypothetical protein OUZ56_025410 [Daphnia magna]|uniref:Uncharacterized protein n=1 Tax=Daphnia magna TaxID=35525 RepID=A0ABQ9ZJS2_9CRUS|nr:hypothetical protein OUZ56_025410 [Daphnia magna]